jgi:hypothetical protein
MGVDGQLHAPAALISVVQSILVHMKLSHEDGGSVFLRIVSAHLIRPEHIVKPKIQKSGHIRLDTRLSWWWLPRKYPTSFWDVQFS